MPGRLRPWLVPGLLALAGVTLHLACGDRYGFFRDELYFVACGRRLAWGYVDQPALAPLLAATSWRLSGEGSSVLLFRLPVYLAHAGSILLGAALARRLGGGALAMALAAAAVLGAPVQLAQGHLLTMNALELLLWSGFALAVLVAAGGRPTAWLAAGGLLGLALNAKFSAALLGAALLLGLVATPSRRELVRGRAWAGITLAAALAAPAAWWQWTNDLPFLELLRNGQAYKNAAISPGALAAGLVLEQGPAGLALAAAGLGALLFRRELGWARFLGVALAALLVALPLLGAKPYYLAPLFPPLFAAGAVQAARLRVPRLAGAALFTVMALWLGVAAPMAVPLLEPGAAARWSERLGVAPARLERLDYPDLPQHLADQLGWPERVAAVVEAWRALPEADRVRAVVYTTNFGRAAALELLGRPAGLPPVISGHNQYFLWGVPGAPEVVLALGGRAEDHATDFAEVRQVGSTPAVAHGMPYESSIPIFVLRGPVRPLAELFEQARHFE